ncbi:MAG: DNA repair protein RadA, partial [Nitrospinaceae bacterium]
MQPLAESADLRQRVFMGRTSTEFVCQACGHRATKWSGKCPDCGEWNAFAEESAKAGNLRKPGKSRPYSQPVLPITAISPAAVHRLSTGIGELDRVLGGGLVPGSLTLIGGDPGIGKSTLVLQSLYAIARAGSCVWYVSGEESPEQIQLRATRLGCLSANLQVCSEICIEEVLRILDRNPPSVMALDSIQTFFTSDLPSAPGTISQVREVAFKVFQACKTRGVPTIIIGHITKDGAIAGPKALEHIVDTVLTFEGDPGHTYRILRAVKNRFGPTPEMGVFEMRESGLEPVTNPSELFLSERPLETPGSVVVGAMEGTRPLMVEVQALVSPSSAIGMARRMASGVDPNRVTL